MTGRIYPSTTSVPQGGRIDFHVSTTFRVAIAADVVIKEFVTGREMTRTPIRVSPPDRAETDRTADRRWPVGYPSPFR